MRMDELIEAFFISLVDSCVEHVHPKFFLLTRNVCPATLMMTINYAKQVKYTRDLFRVAKVLIELAKFFEWADDERVVH